ncbi:NAD(P)/FAD-dependent oxidoreductase [Natribacillus halophilus]|uniref:Sarcosine oxidase subunit alpha n=1 Tax=Natribacillus halophilus TaxID=549003 RepID=A0A1G8R8R9_9BACI|nr:FAD-dependent oxidoreductase [Natribacillus halophilus]SDJ13351.1 sarcosine oxidase subunit alpha [Natribacillus halophilus]
MLDAMIIGAGPAGLSAAISAAQHGLHVEIVDEYYQPGGRLLGQLHQEPDGEWWNGIEETEKLLEQIESLHITIHCSTSVYDLQKVNKKWVTYTDQGNWESQAVLIATGATESPTPIPGWTLPGVMSIGAAQVLTNVQRIQPGERGVVIGVNVLSFAIARELQLAGVDVAGMLLPPPHLLSKSEGVPQEVLSSLLRFSHLAPSVLMHRGAPFVKGRLAKNLVTAFYPEKGMGVWGIPLQLRRTALEIKGKNQVEGIRVAKVNRKGELRNAITHDIDVDFVCIAGGLSPLAELAAIAGCKFIHEDALGGYVPVHNEKMETAVSGLYVAGNITGIESAKVAISQGTIAGLVIAKSLGARMINGKINEALQEVESRRAAATIQFHPHVISSRESLYKTKKTQ